MLTEEGPRAAWKHEGDRKPEPVVQELGTDSGMDVRNWGRSFGEAGLGAGNPHIL